MQDLEGIAAFVTGGGSGVALGHPESHPDYARRVKLRDEQGRPVPGAR